MWSQENVADPKGQINHSGIKECMFIFGDIKTSWCYGQASTGSKHYGRNRAAMALPLSRASSLQQRKGMHCEFNNSWVILKKQSQPKRTTSGFLFLSVENPLLCIRALINFNNISKGSWLMEVRKVEEGREKEERRRKRNAVLKSRFCRIAETDHLWVL